jgi:hypothetical protein
MSIFDVETQIDGNLKDFMNGDKNVLVGTHESPVSLARSYKNGREYTSGYYGDIPVPVTYGPNYIRGKKKVTLPTQEDIRTEKAIRKSIPSKGTGGKEAYVMLMTKHEDKLMSLSPNAKLILYNLFFGGIQWNTGKLMQNRSKKLHTALTIGKLAKLGERVTRMALKELSDKDIVKYDKNRKLYFMSIEIAKKGAVIEDEAKV